MKISLAAARVNAGFTQIQAAKMLKKSTQTIDKWEKGITQIDKKNFDALCRLYKINGDDIFLPY